jgi:hypothetical protein
MPSFAPQEYVALLANQQLPSTAQPALICGMVKQDPNDQAAIMFTMSNCDDWLSLPLALIDSIEHMGEATCKDHKHAVVQISLVAQSSDKTTASLIELLRRTNERLVGALRVGPAGSNAAAPQGGCRVFSGMKGLWICCPDPNGGPEICTGMALR